MASCVRYGQGSVDLIRNNTFRAISAVGNFQDGIVAMELISSLYHDGTVVFADNVIDFRSNYSSKTQGFVTDNGLMPPRLVIERNNFTCLSTYGANVNGIVLSRTLYNDYTLLAPKLLHLLDNKMNLMGSYVVQGIVINTVVRSVGPSTFRIENNMLEVNATSAAGFGIRFLNRGNEAGDRVGLSVMKNIIQILSRPDTGMHLSFGPCTGCIIDISDNIVMLARSEVTLSALFWKGGLSMGSIWRCERNSFSGSSENYVNTVDVQDSPLDASSMLLRENNILAAAVGAQDAHAVYFRGVGIANGSSIVVLRNIINTTTSTASATTLRFGDGVLGDGKLQISDNTIVARTASTTAFSRSIIIHGCTKSADIPLFFLMIRDNQIVNIGYTGTGLRMYGNRFNYTQMVMQGNTVDCDAKGTSDSWAVNVDFVTLENSVVMFRHNVVTITSERGSHGMLIGKLNDYVVKTQLIVAENNITAMTSGPHVVIGIKIHGGAKFHHFVWKSSQHYNDLSVDHGIESYPGARGDITRCP